MGLLVDEAGKLGLDLDDLKDYGFQSNSSCNDLSCIKKEYVKYIDYNFKKSHQRG